MNYEQLRAEKMAALKSKDTVKNNVVTMLLSGMTYLKKEVGRELTDEECMSVIQKELKQVRESLEMSKGREDAAEELRKQIAILEGYLPKQMSEEEVKAKVQSIVEQLGVEPIAKNKGAIMKSVMAELKGKADGKMIGRIVDQLLN